jgi:hypothetical protein
VASLGEALKNFPDRLHFMLRARNEDHSLSKKAFALAWLEDALWASVLIQQETAKTVARTAALTESEFDESALPGEHLHGEFSAIFTGHGPLNGLQAGVTGAAEDADESAFAGE